MKICVTSSGKDLDSKVEEHFGRARYMLIVNSDTMEFDIIENAPQATGGAGTVAAHTIMDKSPAAVLTGRIGPNAFSALRVAQVEIYEGASGHETVRESVERFKKGEYHESSEPSGGSGCT
jgi:predicted Fe-Mo cluster-binding NifX family protein